MRAWRETYGLPTVLSNCSNNYGPYHFPEKLIPLMIISALAGQPLPVYGSGENVRDWLYVEDHARALALVVERGVPGETYNIGGRQERKNIDVVREMPPATRRPRALAKRITRDADRFVADRPGHDRRYAIDPSKIERELGWRAGETFEQDSPRLCAGTSNSARGGNRFRRGIQARADRPGAQGRLGKVGAIAPDKQVWA